MSREGRWRRTAKGLKTALASAVVLAALAGGYAVVVSLKERPTPSHPTAATSAKAASASATAVPLKKLTLKTNPDGVLDMAWVSRTLALPKNASLLDLDLFALRDRLLASGQVISASLMRNFPDTLDVRIAERSPVARVMASDNGAQKMLLVASDGALFEGACFAPERIETLPWLDGIKLEVKSGSFRPIEGMTAVTSLLSQAQLSAARLYASWHIVSLKHLADDGEIEVRTKGGTSIVFDARDKIFPQLAKLDYMWDALLASPTPPARVDLSLGHDVAVSFTQPPATAEVTLRGAPASATPRPRLH